MSDLKRLKMELLNETIYDKSVRPSLNQSKSIEVSLASIIWASSRQNLSSGFPSRRISNPTTPQLQRLARKLKFHL